MPRIDGIVLCEEHSGKPRRQGGYHARVTGEDEECVVRDTVLAGSSSGAPSEGGQPVTIEGGAMPTPGHPSAGVESTLLPQIDRFAVLDRIGQGGMGTVYAAFDRRLDRKVAIKVLNEGVAEEPEHRARMLREAQAMARLSHPNVIPVFEVGEVDERIYVAMEFIEGPVLAQWQTEHRSWNEIVAMYAQIGRGLVAAHERGLVHRDFKPHNVLIGRDGRPRVIDFGLARLEASEDEWPRDRSTAETEDGIDQPPGDAGRLDSPLTRAGAVMGTLAYMAPEQMLGAEVGPASDQFAFCMALYEALYGQRPFVRRSIASMIESLDEPAEVAADGRVPPRIHEAIVRGLAREPEQRWPSLDALLDVLDEDPTTNPTTGWKMRALMTATLLIISVASWPFVQLSPGGVAVLDLVLLAVFGAVPLFAMMWIWRARIARAERSKNLARMAVMVMLLLVIHRCLGWIAEFEISEVILGDHLLIAASAAGTARSIGKWMWLVVPTCLAAALLVALRPQWALESFGAMSVLSLTFGCVGSLWRSGGWQEAPRSSG